MTHAQSQGMNRMYAEVASQMFGGGAGGFLEGGGVSGNRFLTAGEGVLAHGYSNVDISRTGVRSGRTPISVANNRERVRNRYYEKKRQALAAAVTSLDSLTDLDDVDGDQRNPAKKQKIHYAVADAEDDDDE